MFVRGWMGGSGNKDRLSFPLLSRELSVYIKEIPDRKNKVWNMLVIASEGAKSLNRKNFQYRLIVSPSRLKV